MLNIFSTGSNIRDSYVGNTGLSVEAIVNMCNPKPKEIISPNRRFIYEGDLVQYVPEDRKKKLRHVFVFNDSMLVTKKQGNRKYWPRILISFSTGLRCEEVEDSQNDIPGVEFRLYTPKKTIILFASTREERNLWVKMLRDQITELENYKAKGGSFSAPAFYDYEEKGGSFSSNASFEEKPAATPTTNYNYYPDKPEGRAPYTDFNPYSQ